MSTGPTRQAAGGEPDAPGSLAPGAFAAAYRGRFCGLLAWSDVGAVFDAVRASPQAWWIYDTRGPVPEALVPADAVAARVADIESFLRKHHKADYCGFVYADDRTQPQLIKVFDPRNASSCSLGAPVPVYVISRLKPQALPLVEAASAAGGDGAPGDRSGGGGFLRRLIKGAS